VATPVSALEKPIYRFAGFELDPCERRLLAHGKSITLTPKVFDTLVLLVERAGHAVSKDELMSALWPRGFVHESNLTKHIWVIRKALGDNEHDARFIETVPKLGYRFIAPVQRVSAMDPADPGGARLAPSAAPASTDDALALHGAESFVDSSAAAHLPSASEADAPAAPSSGKMLARRARAPAISAYILVAFAVVAIGAGVWLTMQPPKSAVSASGTPGTALAIVDFNNLSQNPKDAWLGPALVEMLGIEATVGGNLHALPDELVRPAHVDLAAPLAGGYAPQSLATLRRRLGADYVLSGSYLVSGSPGEPELRIDLAMQDARRGATLASVSRSGPLANLAALVTQAGAALRDQSGFRPASVAELNSAANAQPPTTEIARRVGFALDALHRNDAARARDELLDAAIQAPGYAPIYVYLAQAWSALGYGQKALAAARQAQEHAAGLPQEQRIQIDAQLHMAQHDWAKAEQSYRALIDMQPKNPEYRFQLISATLAGGKPDVAKREVDALAALAEPGPDDPRLALAETRVAAVRGDQKQRAMYAERALKLARLHDDAGLAAEASTQLGIARTNLGDLAGAEQALKAAREDYVRVGNPHGQAWVDQNVGNLVVGGDVNRAREAYQRALVGYQSIGDLNGEAAIYSDLGRMLWTAGDLDGTETAVRKSLAIRRETADLAGQAWNLAALASIELDSAASDEAASNYREAIALDERAGERQHRAYTLSEYSDLLRLRGDLRAAADVCGQALQGYRETGDADAIAGVGFQCAQIALDSGDLAAAQKGFEVARGVGVTADDSMIIANAELSLGQLAMGRGDCKAAIGHLTQAVDASVRGELVTGEAVAQSQIALCQSDLGHTSERDHAAERTRELRSRITERQEVFAVDIAQADLRGRMGETAAAVSTLRDLAADADQRQWLVWALESRLTAVELLERSHDPAAAGLRAEVESTARRHGFKWVLARLDDEAAMHPLGG
jgi:DNA-binding winged helix-turn-helix (wHTH) protein/tetratricopeptide (TPR) repeat protein